MDLKMDVGVVGYNVLARLVHVTYVVDELAERNSPPKMVIKQRRKHLRVQK